MTAGRGGHSTRLSGRADVGKKASMLAIWIWWHMARGWGIKRGASHTTTGSTKERRVGCRPECGARGAEGGVRGSRRARRTCRAAQDGESGHRESVVTRGKKQVRLGHPCGHVSSRTATTRTACSGSQCAPSTKMGRPSDVTLAFAAAQPPRRRRPAPRRRSLGSKTQDRSHLDLRGGIPGAGPPPWPQHPTPLQHSGSPPRRARSRRMSSLPRPHFRPVLRTATSSPHLRCILVEA